MHSNFLLHLLIVVFSLVHVTSADCRSTGTDFINGGGPYCINATSTDYFSFGTEFEGCLPSDTQGGVTPILINPDTTEYFCSNITTQPDDVEMRSTCNVTGNELSKDQMMSGTWIIVIEGLTFAWMRSFIINAAPPVTYTSTPTATFLITSTPTATSTSTSTAVITTTVPPETVTVPSEILTITSTIIPKPVTTAITSLLTISKVSWTFTKTIQTVTVTPTCLTKSRVWDPECTIRPKKAYLAAATGTSTATNASAPTTPSPHRPRFHKDRAWAQEIHRGASALRPLNQRAADQCTTTIIATTNLPSTTITTTAPTTTITTTTDVTSTSTVTPPPDTYCSGEATTTITTTEPTRTVTKVVRGVTTTVTRSTVWATITSTVKAKPSGRSCVGS